MHDALLLTAAVVCAVAGMGWLALAMDVHWEQVRGAAAPSPAQAMRLRALGSLGLLGALGLCLAVAWRPRWLRVLAWAGGAR
jgi:cell division protein FtsX